jgi:hypothetical protein
MPEKARKKTFSQRRYDMNGRFQMQGGKNWILPNEMNANRFFWDSHWLEIWSNHLFPSMGRNGGIVTMDSGGDKEMSSILADQKGARALVYTV